MHYALYVVTYLKICSNHARYLPIDPKLLAGVDLDEIQAELTEKMSAISNPEEGDEDAEDAEDEGEEDTEEKGDKTDSQEKKENSGDDEDAQAYSAVSAETPIYAAAFQEALESIVVGLRVYTQTNAPATVKGQLRYHPPEAFTFFG